MKYELWGEFGFDPNTLQPVGDARSLGDAFNRIQRGFLQGIKSGSKVVTPSADLGQAENSARYIGATQKVRVRPLRESGDLKLVAIRGHAIVQVRQYSYLMRVVNEQMARVANQRKIELV